MCRPCRVCGCRPIPIIHTRKPTCLPISTPHFPYLPYPTLPTYLTYLPYLPYLPRKFMEVRNSDQIVFNRCLGYQDRSTTE